MEQDWILDVLADLRTFAHASNLPKLAEHLDDSAVIAMAEISALEGRMGNEVYVKNPTVETGAGRTGKGEKPGRA